MSDQFDPGDLSPKATTPKQLTKHQHRFQTWSLCATCTRQRGFLAPWLVDCQAEGIVDIKFNDCAGYNKKTTIPLSKLECNMTKQDLLDKIDSLEGHIAGQKYLVEEYAKALKLQDEYYEERIMRSFRLVILSLHTMKDHMENPVFRETFSPAYRIEAFELGMITGVIQNPMLTEEGRNELRKLDRILYKARHENHFTLTVVSLKRSGRI